MENLQTVTDQCVVALTWTLKDTLGETLDVLDDPVEFLVGGGDLLEKIDQALLGHSVGDSLALHLEPEQAFGDYDETLVFLESRDRFPTAIEEGMTFEGLPDGCNLEAPRNVLYAITEIYPEHVVLDGNHPLAGIALRLQLTVQGIRAATEQEVGRGSVGTGFFKVSPQAPGSPLLH